MNGNDPILTDIVSGLKLDRQLESRDKDGCTPNSVPMVLIGLI